MHTTLIAIIGRYGQERHLPVVARHGPNVVAFFDLNTPAADRIDAIIDLCRRHDVDQVERVVIGSHGCDDGVHDWTHTPTTTIDHATCATCGAETRFDTVRPIPVTMPGLQNV